VSEEFEKITCEQMEEFINLYRDEWMTDKQYFAASAVCIATKGAHHVGGDFKPWGTGVSVSKFVGPCGVSTCDGDLLTRIVLVGHKFGVRISIGPSGPGMIRMIAFTRDRSSSGMTGHRTLQEVTDKWDKIWPLELEFKEARTMSTDTCPELDLGLPPPRDTEQSLAAYLRSARPDSTAFAAKAATLTAEMDR